ncbi:S24/S26 family peptidase [Paenibacillus sp. 1781tsa1]|uniref:S24/S26 family peptidase n=1 Tax=unclassified Paenibacillus TaxID=185978 RepID=UPI00209F32DB|nr:S24/S26 family peptidase [Paenibacillus sp. 1781tsa1]MCP1182180.1 S24/S26 family peptidase [Paenibacillus sp. 1781tsa1]
MHGTRRQDFLIRALQHGKPISILIEGNCMHPLLVHGQRISVYPPGELNEGDVVLVRDPVNRILAHRILSLEHDYVITAGDRNHISDTPLHRCDVLGKLDIPEDQQPYQNPLNSRLPSSQLKVVVHPNALDITTREVLSHAFAVDIVIEENPVNLLMSLREKGWTSIAIHAGAREHLSDLPHTADKLVVFVGYDVGREADAPNGIIGLSDASFVARTAVRYWDDLNAEVSVAAIIGFHMRRTTLCHG